MTFTSAAQASLTTALLLLSASAASALTADELWADWQRLARKGGVEMTATTRREGDRLIVSDLVIPVGEPDELVGLKLPRITLQESPDGSVAVQLPPEFPVTFDAREPGPEIDFLTLTAPSLVLSLDKMVPAPEANERVDFNVAIADLSLTHQMGPTAAAETLATSLRLGTLHLDALVDVDPKDETVAMSVDLSGVSGVLDVVVPPSASQENPRLTSGEENFLPDMLKVLGDGLVMKGEFSHGPFALVTDIKGKDGPARVEMSSASGHAKAGIDAAGLFYDIALGKTEMAAEGNIPDLDYPSFKMSLGELAYGVSMGIGDLVTPQDARLTARMTDLVIPPEIWAEVDPTGALGATPLSFGLDVSMRYALMPEMLDPAWKPEPEVFPPMDIVELALKELSFDGFGMSFGGNGALTFDESDLVTFEGAPAPDGKLAFQATGVNGLIDRLAKAGLIPEDELTGLRLGLMFIAKVGEAPDSLVSSIEFKEKSFYLNGQKLR